MGKTFAVYCMNQSLILTNYVPNGYFLCFQVNWNLSAFGCSYFCVSFSHMRENLRGLIKKFKTQNPCLKSNSVAGIWTSLWLHCFSWSESSAHETHPTFWGCFVFTSFSLIYLFFFSSCSCFCFLFFTNTIVVLFFDLGFDWKYVGVDDFFLCVCLSH